MNVTFEHTGDFSTLEKLLNYCRNKNYLNILSQYGREGVAALSAATPVKTGLTASSWNYKIIEEGSTVKLTWINTNIKDGHNIAILLQYGHGTGTGGYVSGTDYINPAIKPIFDDILKRIRSDINGK